MKTACGLAAALGLAALGAPALAAPLDAYGHLPSIQQVAISPDGKDLALIVTNGDQRAVVVETAADQKPIDVMRAGEQKLREIEWGGPNHIVMTISIHGALQSPYGPIMGGGQEHLIAVDYDLTDHHQTMLMNDVQDALNIVYGEPETRVVGGKPVAFMAGQIFLSDMPTGTIGLFSADLDAHTTKLVDLGPQHVSDWTVDALGRPLAITTYDAPSSTWTLRLAAGDA